MARVVGEVQLMNRLKAVRGQGETGVIKLISNYTRGRMVLNMEAMGARKTGLTAGSLRPVILGPTKAVIMGSPVAVWIDIGTGLYGPKHHVIVPVTKKALFFPSRQVSAARFGAGKVKFRKSGALTAASLRSFGNAAYAVVRSVRGMKPRPYIFRSVSEAASKVGSEIGAQITTAWNTGGK